MERIPVSEARDQISEILNRVAYRGERIVLHRRGKELAALIPMADLQILMQGQIHSGAAAPADAIGAGTACTGDAVPSGRVVDDVNASPWIPRSL